MSARGLYRGVYSSLLDDQDFCRLSPEARHVFHTLRLSKEAGPGCIWQCNPEVLVGLVCSRTGYRPACVRRALTELTTHPSAERPWLFRDVSTGVMWIRNGLRHDPTANLGNVRQLVSVIRALLSLPKSDLVDKFLSYYGIRKAYGIASRKGIDSLWHSSRTRAPAPNTDIRLPISDIRAPRRSPSAASEGLSPNRGNGPGPDEPTEADRQASLLEAEAVVRMLSDRPERVP